MGLLAFSRVSDFNTSGQAAVRYIKKLRMKNT